VRTLLAHHDSYDRFPATLVDVLHVEQVTQSEASRQRLRHVAHWPMATLFSLAEVDLSSLVSKEAWASTAQESHQRNRFQGSACLPHHHTNNTMLARRRVSCQHPARLPPVTPTQTPALTTSRRPGGERRLVVSREASVAAARPTRCFACEVQACGCNTGRPRKAAACSQTRTILERL
jgi:hypothetical protein